MKTHSHPLFFGGGRDSTSPIFQHTKPKLSVWLDSFGDKWEEECLFFLIKRMNWPSEAVVSIRKMDQQITQDEVVSANGSGCIAQCPTPFSASLHDTLSTAEQISSQRCASDLCRTTPHPIAHMKKKKRHKDWMSDTFVHFCVTEDRRSILLVQLYWWNINKATMPLLKAGTSPVCTDLKPWQ